MVKPPAAAFAGVALEDACLTTGFSLGARFCARSGVAATIRRESGATKRTVGARCISGMRSLETRGGVADGALSS
jgi:hypothetical protein